MTICAFQDEIEERNEFATAALRSKVGPWGRGLGVGIAEEENSREGELDCGSSEDADGANAGDDGCSGCLNGDLMDGWRGCKL